MKGVRNTCPFWLSQDVLHLLDAGWVAPDEWIKHGRHGKKFDDVMKDSNGNYYVIEYKGGDSGLDPGQMQDKWVTEGMNELDRLGCSILSDLVAAWSAGKLRGISLKTPWLNKDAGTFAETKILKYHGTYTPPAP